MLKKKITKVQFLKRFITKSSLNIFYGWFSNILNKHLDFLKIFFCVCMCEQHTIYIGSNINIKCLALNIMS